MKRDANSLCLLCETKPASKRNSHIASKFLGKTILGDSGPRKAHILDSGKPDVKPIVLQDSPKEDYILCPDCEKYFEILETYVSEFFFKRILNSKYNADFYYAVNEGGVEYAICPNLDIRIFRLFIFSLFWRCSISEEEPFTAFKLQNENQLRVLLMESFTTEFEKLREGKASATLYEMPIVVMRPKSDLDKTKNVFYANDTNKDLYQLILNEYIFFIALNDKTKLAEMDFLNNIGNKDFTVGLMGDGMWTGLRNDLINLAVKKYNEAAKRLGVKPYNVD